MCRLPDADIHYNLKLQCAEGVVVYCTLFLCQAVSKELQHLRTCGAEPQQRLLQARLARYSQPLKTMLPSGMVHMCCMCAMVLIVTDITLARQLALQPVLWACHTGR